MKKHNLFKVALITILLVVLASWILPVTSVSGKEFSEVESGKIGLFSVVSYVAIAIQYFCHIALYVLAIGGLYGILHKIPSYRVMLDKIVSGFRHCEWVFMIIVSLVFCLLSSMAGLSLPILAFFPFVIAVILLMGYDKITAAMLTVGSVTAGLIGSVFSSNDIYGLSYVLGVEANQDVGWKILILVLSYLVVIINVLLYARKHKDTENLVQGIFVPEKVDRQGVKKILPIAIVLDVMLVVLALAFISWSVFGVTVFTEFTDKFINPTGSGFTKGVYTAFNTVLGLTSNNAFGLWTLLEASVVLVLGSLILAFIYRKSFTKFLNEFANGAKHAIKPAVLIIMAYTVLVCITNVNVLLTVLKPILSLDGELNVFVMCIVAIVYSIFTVESYYGVRQAAPYVTAFVATENVGKIALIWQSMYGLTMLVAPTSVILMSTLSYLDISYGRWLKSVWKLLLELFLVLLIVLLLI
ncbi:MAG: hypothetical protein IJ568_03100 [Bacilli bacterium]|nr:hypothetical protein [Bacilli bacterium]